MLRCSVGLLALVSIKVVAAFSPVKTSPQDIEKLVCKFASQKQIEDKAIDDVCSLIEQKFPSIKKGECMSAAEVAWDRIVAMCPKGRAIYEPNPQDIEKLVCKLASQKQIEEKAIDEVCSLIEQKFPSMKKGECMAAAEVAWDRIVAMCPKGRVMYDPNPAQDIEKLVCKFASQKQIEDKAIDEVCSLIEQKLPSVKKGECVGAAEMAWDKIVAMCPKGHEMYEPNPAQDIEKLVCKVASRKQIEEKAIDEVCSLISQKFPSIKKGECMGAAEVAWDRIVAMCPKGRAIYDPNPAQDIEKLVCKLASQKQIEEKAIDEVCSLISQKVPSIKKGECMGAAEMAWDKIVAMCPKGREMYGNSPAPEIEKLVCKFASQKQIEEKAIDEVCSLIEQKFPSIKKGECMAASEVAWDKIVAMCPKGRVMNDPNPAQDIEKLVCKFATQKQIEDKAIDEVCSLIEQKLPSIKKGECMGAAEMAWDKIVAMCPKGHEMYEPNPAHDIEKLVCKVASQKQIEEKAIDEVCSLISQKFPSIKKGECVGAAEMAWDRIVAMCPKGRAIYDPKPAQDIEKLVCKFASQKQIEEKAIDEVCSLIEQKIPSIKKGECMGAAEVAWDKIVAMCPKGREMYEPNPAHDIEKLVCKVASQKQIEEKAIDEVCSLISQKFSSIKKGECMGAAEMAWDKIVAMCPKGREMYEPSPAQDIEKLVCKLATQKQIEDKAVDEVCSKIQQQHPRIPMGMCMKIAEAGWDRIVKMCAKAQPAFVVV